jgi:hypothetical protein
MNWYVKMRCVVMKDVLCVACTEEEARENPWEFAADETEIDQIDWEVLSVTEDK